LETFDLDIASATTNSPPDLASQILATFLRKAARNMASSSQPIKRKASHDAPISPPPLRRKTQVKSTTTREYSEHRFAEDRINSSIENAVASFFTPASKKPSGKVIWHERAPNDDAPSTLLVGKYRPTESPSTVAQIKRAKIAAFDFVS
jgi:bifunctional polynucleotide phosphatase/kinase